MRSAVRTMSTWNAWRIGKLRRRTGLAKRWGQNDGKGWQNDPGQNDEEREWWGAGRVVLTSSSCPHRFALPAARKINPAFVLAGATGLLAQLGSQAGSLRHWAACAVGVASWKLTPLGCWRSWGRKLEAYATGLLAQLGSQAGSLRHWAAGAVGVASWKLTPLGCLRSWGRKLEAYATWLLAQLGSQAGSLRH
ncbi:hypothetical protein Enr13x_42890 [Stieleria neptunia]|uniref:Uncharacterized protein n=1 Tax=Stieleria neptunia TaxID=2527979 RepID=A0A518HUF3_9BACT|nr:hypothetical protein Enr13x_42890 [Stieleria neptunia]